MMSMDYVEYTSVPLGRSTSAAGDTHKAAHYGCLEDPRVSAEEMDVRRRETIAYEYLCRLQEAKVWIEACIRERVPDTVDLEEGLRNGVVLAKLAHFISPEVVPKKKIFDSDLSRYKARGLQFRHTDNINHWIRSLQHIDMPRIFYPETTDIYDRKNMPRAIYCIHALSLYLFKLGRAPQIQDLYGKISFTDEQISNMRKELDKYGIQMPAFSKINGILANEMPIDEAALHAAVIAINEAIEHNNSYVTVTCLLNQEAGLYSVVEQLQDLYQPALYRAKQCKAELIRDRSLDSDYVKDAYDELLTQSEIQQNINSINGRYAVDLVIEALDRRDKAALLAALNHQLLGVGEVDSTLSNVYLQRLLELLNNRRNSSTKKGQSLSREEIQSIISSINQENNNPLYSMDAVADVNKALCGADAAATYKALQNPMLKLLSQLDHTVQALYHEELKNMRDEKQEDLDFEEISGSLPVLLAIAKISLALDRGNPRLTFAALSAADAHITDLDVDYQQKYHQQLTKLRENKRRRSVMNGDDSGSVSDLLTHCEIQQCINDVNIAASSDNQRVEMVRLINESVEGDDSYRTLQLLKQPAAGLAAVAAVRDSEALHYHNILHLVKQQKAEEMQDPTAELWYEEIQSTVDLCNSQAELAHKLCVCVGAVNIALEQENERSLVHCLQELRETASTLHISTLYTECSNEYMKCLASLRARKEKKGDCGSGWMMLRMDESGFRYYFNVETMKHSWVRTPEIKKDHSLLTLDDIQTCVEEISRERDKLCIYRSQESHVIQIQAAIRGALVRRKYKKQRKALARVVSAVVMIQSWWRMLIKRREYLNKLRMYRENALHVIAVQARARMYLARKNYQKSLQYYKSHEWAAVKIQAFMRSVKARQDYRAFIQGENPSLNVVRKFVHLLDVGDQDYTEEIELEKIRQHVIGEIRGNKHLEQDLNQMDIKIGLLVRNRLTLQDVLSHSRTLKKYETLGGAGNSAGSRTGGLKALSKASRERLEAYQHLFYLLQTNPIYLAKLIFEMPQSRMSRFLESALLTLYNYASSPREEYLLLRLFKTALEQEIRSKVHSITDIMTGNPIVIKIIVGFNRNTRGGSSSLRELLNPLVRSVVDGGMALKMNTNPVEVYKQWVNQTEAETGRALGLPYEVSVQEALEHGSVRERIEESVECVKRVTESFLSTILQSMHLIPYGMRYMAKVMRDTLRAKFPNSPDKELLKMVGNLIYYRYINSAIVAPDAFDILDVGAANGLSSEQRRNLGSVAKILQFAASNKGFGSDSPHLVSLNKYIMDAHIRFKKYFSEICEVEEPEIYFKMDQYTDVSRVTKPVIYISVGEIIEIHRLLLEHQSSVAPDVNDPLHELLDDLGDVHDVDTLLGTGEGSAIEDTAVCASATAAAAGSSAVAAVVRAQLSKTEISLTLNNKFEAKEEDMSDKNSLLLRTKRMVIDLIRCQRSGDNLVQVLNSSTKSEEEAVHQALIRARERLDLRAANKQAKLLRQPSMIADTKLPLEAIKKKIMINLDQLERLGVVSRRDMYQSVVNSIIQDIRNQRMYRQQRRFEMLRLSLAASGLREKRAFYEEQINYYNQYVKTCLDKQNTAKTKKTTSNKTVAKITIKYSANKLHEKGVVLEIEGLPLNQFKNVLFEISSTDVSGVFDVNAKFMGVSMEKVQLLFQDLLELQYEGVAVMKMFDRAKINVNLLIFLLNKKFFTKK